MSRLKVKYHIKEMAEYLKVSRSAFYRWQCRVESPKARQDAALKVHIKVLFDESGKTYGAKRISLDLKDEGVKCGKFRTRRLMKELSLTPKAKRKYKATTDSNHSKETAPNLLGQKFAVAVPDRVWVGDITYVPTHEGWALSRISTLPYRLIKPIENRDSGRLGDERPAEKRACDRRV